MLPIAESFASVSPHRWIATVCPLSGMPVLTCACSCPCVPLFSCPSCDHGSLRHYFVQGHATVISRPTEYLSCSCSAGDYGQQAHPPTKACKEASVAADNYPPPPPTSSSGALGRHHDASDCPKKSLMLGATCRWWRECVVHHGIRGRALREAGFQNAHQN